SRQGRIPGVVGFWSRSGCREGLWRPALDRIDRSAAYRPAGLADVADRVAATLIQQPAVLCRKRQPRYSTRRAGCGGCGDPPDGSAGPSDRQEVGKGFKASSKEKKPILLSMDPQRRRPCRDGCHLVAS